MGLKQDIVVKSEFTVKDTSGRAQRGNSPGRYITAYMTRDGACEDMAPVKRFSSDGYIERYMMRASAVERAHTLEGVHRGLEEADGYAGLAFGCAGRHAVPEYSLSDARVRELSRKVQREFDAGKTVLKTVLSFDGDYLARTGITSPGFVPSGRGSYRGNIDQMKLRRAIATGVERMGAGRFDDLMWVGVIQVDTEHVHCHLAMVDAGVGRIHSRTGKQLGTLSNRDRMRLRRGIDLALDEMQPQLRYAKDVSRERVNTRAFVKHWTYEAVSAEMLPQLLFACLPEDKRKWRAGSHAQDMRRANAVAASYVDSILQLPGSGWPEAIASVDAYALARAQREGAGPERVRELVRSGRQRIFDDCVNGVYAVMREVDRSAFTVETPMLDLAAIDVDDLISLNRYDPLLEFGFKLRSYSSRLAYHVDEAKRMSEAADAYETALVSGRVDAAAASLGRFYHVEAAYQSQCAAKYQHFMAALTLTSVDGSMLDGIMQAGERVRGLAAITEDTHLAELARRDEDAAEALGIEVYKTHGGRWAGTRVAELRHKRAVEDYRHEVARVLDTLADRGWTLACHRQREEELEEDERELFEDEDDDGTEVVVGRDIDGIVLTGDETFSLEHRPAYEFDDVKALDIHHLAYDFSFDAAISQNNIQRFCAVTDWRTQALEAAKAYLIGSGQKSFVSTLPVEDCELMRQTADALRQNPAIARARRNGMELESAPTISLDYHIAEDMSSAVRASVEVSAHQLTEELE